MPAGTVACDKTSVYATSRSGGVGEGGCRHATSRRGNVDKNNQIHYKNEYNNNTTTTKTLQERVQSNKQTNKQRSKKQGEKKETNTQTTNKKTNTQIDKEQTDTTPPQQTARAILPTHNNRTNCNNKKTTSDQRVSEGRARMIQQHIRHNSNIRSGFARAQNTNLHEYRLRAHARTQ